MKTLRYILDTNVISECMKDSPAPAVEAWMAQHEEVVALSTLTLAEMAFGVETLPMGKRRFTLERELRFVQEDYAERIIAFDENAAWEWARYVAEAEAAGFSPPLMDSLIAATARAWGLKVATRNQSDFPLVDTVNPFES